MCLFERKNIMTTIGGYRQPAEQAGGKTGGKNRGPD